MYVRPSSLSVILSQGNEALLVKGDGMAVSISLLIQPLTLPERYSVPVTRPIQSTVHNIHTT